ncbi:30S ribosomal protein S8 [Candidatus Saccharibacteria bacterium]|nr:30S ribosomal protein S8 [Candidatus Saccharibacteria bacterium]
MTNLVSTDPIADMLSRVRNAVAVNKNEVSMPHSKLKETVAKILADNGFLSGVEINELNSRKMLVIKINSEDESAKITSISRLSRPGRRMYVKSTAIPTVRRGRGLVVISTSKGIMTGKQAVNQKLGGELICEVY